MPQDRDIKIGNINTRYWAEGDNGSNVILIHGLGASVDIWMHNILAIAERHRVYAPDLVGFGRSDKPDVK
jgi:pimeloyl-ACP methyl ester carboxylesterase